MRVYHLAAAVGGSVMTLSDLLQVVYRFYPRGLYCTDESYKTTEEHFRYREAGRRAVAAYPTWKAMLGRLEARCPVFNDSLVMAGRYREDGRYGSAYSAYLERPGRTLEFHVSILGPYYGIYRTSAPGEEAAALDLVREIESTFPGYEEIPPELGDEVVPDVVSLGTTTIYHCLLSDRWGLLSSPWPPRPPKRWPQDYPDASDDEPSDPEVDRRG
jgi:hypothetical protein